MRPPNFIDKPEQYGPFNGALLVLNIGQDNIDKLGIRLGSNYYEELVEAIADAMADGWAIMYLFDSEHGVSEEPDGFEDHEDITFRRLLGKTCGMEVADFSLIPSERKKQFESMRKHLQEVEDLVVGDDMAVMGSCKIGGDKVLMPLTPI